MTVSNAGAYCREVESYLCRRNGGHLIRIVGPSFEMVRGWADAGVPVSLVQRAIDVCAERREARREAAKPLRIEFCESEVRDQFQRWRRAVGPYVAGLADEEDAEDAAPAGLASVVSLASHLIRASEKLARAAARLERSEAFRAALDAIVGGVAAVQSASKGARGDRRDAFVQQLKTLDQQLLSAARAEATQSGLDAELRAKAAEELAPWRERMPRDAWVAAVQAASDRLVRDRLDLPDLAP
jgi:hypothetical protein